MRLFCVIVILVMSATATYSQGDASHPDLTKKNIPTLDSTRLESGSSAIYRIGLGDLLDIAVEQTERTYSVRSDGTIDFPLSRGSVRALGHTVEELGASLSNSITVYKTPRVTVRVREYVSHAVLVEGMVDLPGTHQIQRDSVPLYVIRAMTGVHPNAMLATIARADGRKEEHLLHRPESDLVTIYPGDRLEFKEGRESNAVGYYFLRLGGVATRPLRRGLTLSQIVGDAKYKIAEVGSYMNGSELNRKEFNLREIARGKVVDPVIRQGDIVSFR